MIGKKKPSWYYIVRQIFHCLRQFVPSILNKCPPLRVVFFDFGDLFIELPCDDSAAASDGQSVAKWLFTPLQNDVLKVLTCQLNMDGGILASKIEAVKALTNEFTPEQLHWKGLTMAVVNWRETKVNGRNGKRKRLIGEFIINGTELTLQFIMRMTSAIVNVKIGPFPICPPIPTLLSSKISISAAAIPCRCQ
ncbi:hypothetical protein niasHT_031554 [Heterodera trifolii]|uniref:Uncharacterized protein n=1 Tax=Heterodera trifolii TaxID=157864 RepID=A0ABD2HSA0_9BILA